jgi:hypothetical protein
MARLADKSGVETRPYSGYASGLKASGETHITVRST